jgi:hypothetical protein
MELTPEAASRGVNKLALMAFFPADPEVRGALIGLLMEMIETEEQLNWLVADSLKSFREWPGIGALRERYCSRYRPKDGIEA